MAMNKPLELISGYVCWRCGLAAGIAGMTLWATGVFLGLYFAISIAVTRMRAELGTPVHDLWYRGSTGPDTIMATIFGAKQLGPANLTVMELFYGFNRDYRNHPQPHH